MLKSPLSTFIKYFWLIVAVKFTFIFFFLHFKSIKELSKTLQKSSFYVFESLELS